MEIRMSEEEYNLAVEDAKKVLETLDPEAINGLKNKCVSEIRGLTTVLEKAIEESNESLKSTYQPSDNPFRNAKRNYWLGQIANFIAVSIFRIPREFTPTYGYPHGASKLAEEYDKFANDFDAKIDRIIRDGKLLCESSLGYFSELKNNISNDNVSLIMFCNSCNNIESLKGKVNTNPRFAEMATLLYENNITFSSDIYNMDLKDDSVTDKVSSLILDVSAEYEKSRDNERQKRI